MEWIIQTFMFRLEPLLQIQEKLWREFIIYWNLLINKKSYPTNKSFHTKISLYLFTTTVHLLISLYKHYGDRWNICCICFRDENTSKVKSSLLFSIYIISFILPLFILVYVLNNMVIFLLLRLWKKFIMTFKVLSLSTCHWFTLQETSQPELHWHV